MTPGEAGRTGAGADLARFARAGRTMSGLEFLRAIGSGELPVPPMLRTLGIGPVEVEEGRAVFEVAPLAEHTNPLGTVHGGLAATLCDTAMGCAVHSLLPRGGGYTTLEVKVNFVRPVTPETGRVVCEGSVLHRGSRTATARAEVRDAAGALLAHATTTCLVFSAEDRG